MTPRLIVGVCFALDECSYKLSFTQAHVMRSKTINHHDHHRLLEGR